MVNLIVVFLFCLFFQPLGADENVQVSANVNEYQTLAPNLPFKVTVMVTHNAKDAVDEKSFKLDAKPLVVEKVQDQLIGTGEVISIYQFQMAGTTQGLHLLPIVSVKVGKNTYQSIQTTYVVNANAPAQPALPAAAPPPPSPTPTPAPAQPAGQPAQPAAVQLANAPTLALEQAIEGPQPLYPGSRARFIYRYVFSGEIQTTKEVLPLLDAEGFLKVGKAEQTEYNRGDKSIYEVSQIVQAIKPGDYKFGPAIVEAKAKIPTNLYGGYQYASNTLHAETPPIAVSVQPFPTQSKPASFTGAVGKYDFQVKLLSPQEVIIGDKIKLEVDITGQDSSVMENIQLPDLCCQPGMSGLFLLSDLPPVGTVSGNTKRFEVEMRPLSTAAKEIPSLEFSYFDPVAGKVPNRSQQTHSDSG